MEIRWVTAFIDRPADTFDAAAAFWCELTGSSLSTARGEHGEFATLVPDDGDPCLRIQRVHDGPGGTHVDLHVDDVRAAAAEAAAAGAERVADHGGYVIMRSPAGLAFCLVAHHGELTLPGAQSDDAAGTWKVDQVCVDVPADRHQDECRFWTRLTGWPVVHSRPHPEMGWFRPPVDTMLRLVVQRRDDSQGPARAHLDLSSSDRATLARRLEDKGAQLKSPSVHWVVMADPSGLEFCITGRDPATGVLDHEERWETDDDLARARARFGSLIEGYQPSVAYSLARIDPGVDRPVFAHVNEPGGSHLLPGVVLAYVAGHSAGTATYELTAAQVHDAIWLLSPAEAATHWDHPNLWSWRTLVEEAPEGTRYVAVFVGDLADAPVDAIDAALRARLHP